MALRLANKSEQQKFYLLVGLLFLMANYYGLDWFNSQRQQLSQSLSKLEADKKYDEAVLSDQPLLEKREAWLEKNQPRYDDSGQGSSKLMDTVQNLVKDNNITIVDRRLVDPKVLPHFQEVSVQLNLLGSTESVCRLLGALQQPNQFRAITMLSIKADSDPTKIRCEVQISAWNRKNS